MGKSIWGPFGPMTGKIGNLVYYRANGVNRVRTIGKITVPPTPAQLQIRMQMKVISQFLKLLTELLNVGFKMMAKVGSSPFNAATAYNIRHALTGLYPDVSIDYSKVMISMGSLELPTEMDVQLTTEGLQFTWDGTSPNYYPRPDDQALLLAYFPGQHKAVYELYGPNRQVGLAKFPLPDDLIAEPMVVYMAFVSPDRKRLSNSVYLGWVNANEGVV
ncbi:MAG: DUF6266 family protein [Bacteroidota bacterium]